LKQDAKRKGLNFPRDIILIMHVVHTKLHIILILAKIKIQRFNILNKGYYYVVTVVLKP
jgi:hypothetical protein